MEGKIVPADSLDTRVESLVNYFNEVIIISDYEKGIVRQMIRVISEPLPATKALIEIKIDSLLSLKSEINYLVLRIKDIRRAIDIPHRDMYNTQFMILTKQGRPSTESKIAEIYSLNKNLRNLRDKLSNIDNLLNFMGSNIDLIDGKIKILESRKYSL